VQRGIETLRMPNYFSPVTRTSCMTPLMKDMDKAVLESKKAIENQERMSI
jgi:hypothetical protein